MILGRLSEFRRDRRIGRRGVGGAQEVAVELSRSKRGGTDLDETKPGSIRERAASAQPENLASCARARLRETARSQDDVLLHPVDGRDPDEPSGDRALAEEDERRRPREPDAVEGVVHVLVECAEALGSITGNAEPDRTHGPVGRRNALDRLRGRAIGCDRHAREHSRKDRGRDSKSRERDERPAVAAAEAPPCEPRDETRRPHETAFRRWRYAAVFARFPQIDIEHQVDEAFREPS